MFPGSAGVQIILNPWGDNRDTTGARFLRVGTTIVLSSVSVNRINCELPWAVGGGVQAGTGGKIRIQGQDTRKGTPVSGSSQIQQASSCPKMEGTRYHVDMPEWTAWPGRTQAIASQTLGWHRVLSAQFSWLQHSTLAPPPCPTQLPLALPHCSCISRW